MSAPGSRNAAVRAGSSVLVTSASRKVSLVQAFARALREEGGGHVVAVDCEPRSAALHVADVGRVVPRSDAAEFWDALLAIVREHEVGLLIPTRDEELPYFAARRAELEALGVTLPLAPLESIALCQDKLAFARFCATEGFPITPLVEGPTLEDPARYPLFARARLGKSGRSAFRLDSPIDLARRRAEHGALLVQELVRAPELSLDIFADLTGQVLSVVPRVRGVVVAGESYVTRTLEAPELVELGRRLAERLSLRGHAVAQVFDRTAETPSRYEVIEVNPRFGGASALGMTAGLDSARALVRLARGEPVASSLGRYEVGLTMLRYTQDLFVQEGV
jgi:carbamoyl-phosphate synthase large subunit